MKTYRMGTAKAAGEATRPMRAQTASCTKGRMGNKNGFYSNVAQWIDMNVKFRDQKQEMECVEANRRDRGRARK